MKKFTCPFLNCPKYGEYTSVRSHLAEHFNQKHSDDELRSLCKLLFIPDVPWIRWKLQQKILDCIAEKIS